MGCGFVGRRETANDQVDSQGPLGRRVREIWMDARFDNNGENTETVERCVEDSSQIFQYFSGLLLDKYMSNDAPYDHNDPLKVGRDVLDELYKFGKRSKTYLIEINRFNQVSGQGYRYEIHT